MAYQSKAEKRAYYQGIRKGLKLCKNNSKSFEKKEDWEKTKLGEACIAYSRHITEGCYCTEDQIKSDALRKYKMAKNDKNLQKIFASYLEK